MIPKIKKVDSFHINNNGKCDEKKLLEEYQLEEKIIEIIEKLTDFKDLNNNRDIDLLENEILDSLAFIELIEMLNDEFNIEIQPTKVSPDTWRSVKKIAEYIKQLKKQCL